VQLVRAVHLIHVYIIYVYTLLRYLPALPIPLVYRKDIIQLRKTATTNLTVAASLAVLVATTYPSYPPAPPNLADSGFSEFLLLMGRVGTMNEFVPTLTLVTTNLLGIIESSQMILLSPIATSHPFRMYCCAVKLSLFRSTIPHVGFRDDRVRQLKHVFSHLHSLAYFLTQVL
jgi:hypothetical protein